MASADRKGAFLSLRFDPKNDAEAKGVHFLGLMRPTGTFEPIVLA